MSIQIPKLILRTPSLASVERWGQIGRLVFRAGDRLVLGEEKPGALLLFAPLGHGRPMLGRRTGGRLVAEPGGIPASSRRWRVIGSVVAIEREFERSILGGGRWYTCSRIRVCGSQPDMPAARVQFRGGWLEASDVDLLTLRASTAPERLGVEVACAVASQPDEARALLADTSPGCIRIGMASADPMLLPSVIPGPWPEECSGHPGSSKHVRLLASETGVQMTLFGDNRLMHAC